jgi:digeranylgeranylglycerophospholipid reductase
MFMIRRDYEVLVVGAGPAGSATARRLAELGHEVALVDENEGPRCEVICSGIVSLEAYRRFDLPRDAVVDVVRGSSFFSPAGERFHYRPPTPLAYVVDRTRFDARLAENAVAAGAVLLQGHAATRVRVSGTGVETMVRVAGHDQVLRSRALVVATGYRTRLHEQAGLGRPMRFVQGTHQQIPFEALEEAEVYFGRGVAPGFFAWAVPFGASAARVGLMTRRGGRNFLEDFVQSPAIRSRLGAPAHRSSDPAAANGSSLGRILSRGIVQGPVTPSFATRVVAVGEAAGQVKTTTGGGLYYGLIGADLAAEILSSALMENRLSAEGLQPYHHTWLARFGHEIRSGLRLQRLGATLQDGEIEEIFRLLQGGLGSGMKRLVHFDWHRQALRLLFRSPGLQWMLARRVLQAALT